MIDAKLKSLVERAEKIIEERKAVGGDLRDIFSEAKGVGYEPRYLRKIISERAMDAADLAEQEAVMDAYRHALGMVAASVSNGDMSLREAAKQSGFSKSAIHRVSHQTRDNVSGTVEMHADNLGAAEPDARQMVAEDLGDWRWVDRADAEFAEKIRSIAASVKVASRQEESRCEAPAERAEIDLTIPEFLKRERGVVARPVGEHPPVPASKGAGS